MGIFESLYPEPTPEPEPPKEPTFLEKALKKAKEKVPEVVAGIRRFLFGEEVVTTVVGRPTAVQLSDEEYVGIVGSVMEYKEQAMRQLEDAIKARDEYYRQGIKQVDPALEKRVAALEWAVEDYDEFLGNEPTNRGFFRELFKHIKRVGVTPDFYEDLVATKQGKALIRYTRGEEITPEEQGYINSFRARKYNELIKKGLAPLAAETTASIPKYALLIWMTSSAVKPITGKAEALITAKIPPGKANSVVSKILQNSINLALASNLNIPGLDARTAEYMLPSTDYEKAINSDDILKELKPGDAPMKAKRKAYLSNLVEYISEGAGGYIDDALPFVKKAIIGKWLAKRGISKVAGPNIIKSALRASQFNSMVGEIFEEEIAEPLQAIIEEREYFDPLFTPEGRERLLVEILGIGAFSGIAKVSDVVINKAVSRRGKNQDVISIPIDTTVAEVVPPEEPVKPVEPRPEVPPVITEEIEKREIIKVEAKPEGVKSAIATIKPDGTAGMVIEIEKEARGKGLGTEVAKELEKKLIDKGVEKVEIGAFVEAQGFWEKQGYVVVEGAKEKAGMIKMEKELKPEVEKPPVEKVPVKPITEYKVGQKVEWEGKKYTIKKIVEKPTPTQIRGIRLRDETGFEIVVQPEEIGVKKPVPPVAEVPPTKVEPKAEEVPTDILRGERIPEKVPAIPKELEPLAVEARKYGSAGEFRKALGEGKLEPFFSIRTYDPKARTFEYRVAILDEKGNLKSTEIKSDDFYTQATEIKPPVEKAPPKVVKPAPPKPKPVVRPPKKLRRLPKTDTAKLYTQINKKNRMLPIIQENVKAKDGKLHFTDLSVSVTTPTKLKDGMYRVIGKDFRESVAPAEDYPVIPGAKKRVGRILLENMADIYSKFKTFVSRDEMRPILTGLQFKTEKGLLTVTATDGFRLFHQKYGMKIDKPFSFVVGETKTLASILSILKEGVVEILESKDMVTFTDGVSEVTVRKVEGEFPDYARIAPSFEHELVVDKKALLQAVKDIEPYAKEMANIVRIDLEEKEIVLRAKREELEKKVSVPIKKRKSIKLKKGGLYQGSIIMPVKTEDLGDKSFALNYRYLNDSLKNLDGDEVFLHLNERQIERVVKKKKVKATVLSQSPIHISDVAEEPVYPPKKKVEKPVKAPSGYADKGEYAELENLSIEGNKINIVEFPELVTIARQLDGIPKISKRIRSAGTFDPSLLPARERIRLRPEIFKDPETAAKVLAHELGHLADFLPQKMMQRGNVVGRIASLNRHLKHKYGKLEDPVIRDELKRLSQVWKPFDEYESENYTKYRYSSKELYADAISVLFNDPKRLKQEAPNFWEGFFDYIDRKPKVKENFFAIWELLTEGEEAVLSKRQKSIRDSFTRGEDQFILLQEERLRRRKDFVFRLKYELIDKNQAVIDLVEKSKKEGKVINDDDNPVYWLEEQNYLGGVVKSWVETTVQPIYKEIMDSELAWEDFGEVLFHERVMNERGELANPLGFNPKTSEQQLAYLERKLGKEKWSVLQKNLPKFRQAISEVTEKAEEAELYSPELIKEMKANPAYATFQVIDYMDLYLSASVKRQVGTLKEITNPATATVMKSISIIRAAERNMAKGKLTGFLKEFASKEITAARTRWTGKLHEPIDSREPHQKLFTLMEKGKVKGYYVDPYIASTFDYLSTGTNNAVVGLLRFFNSKLFRPMFITFNLGFQSFNLMRDFSRFYKNTPQLSLLRAFKRYAEAVPAAKARGWDIPNKTIQEMEKSKLLGMTYNDIISGRTNSDKQIEKVIEKVGLSALKGKKTKFFLKPFVKILDTIERMGDMIETIPKVAGYKELNGKMPSKALGSFIRTSVGSPDFLRRGAGYGWYNEAFLFSNAIKEGVRADFNVAFKNPKTRAGFWWKTTLLSFLPKVIMFAGLSGLFGAALKKMLEDVSEYDKTNYTILPLGRKNNQTTYLRIPQDETGRLMGGILWKILRINSNNKPIMTDVSDLLSYTGGQLPSVTPVIEALTSTAQFLAGKNPYDFFRGRSVIPDDAFEAGGKYSLKPFLTWQLNQLGAGVFWKGYVSTQAPEDKTWIQKVVETPILSNIIGRWIKVSNYGQNEKNKAILKGVGREEARRRIEEREKINDAIKEYQAGTQNMVRRRAIERKLVKDIVGDAPYKKERKTKQTNVLKKFKIGIIRGEADQNINSIIAADTNAQKVELLRRIKTQMDSGEYNDLIKLLKSEKIISENVIKELKKEQKQSMKLNLGESLLGLLVKPAYAAEKLANPEDRKRWYGIAIEHRKNNPAWYTKHIGKAGEISIFGHTIGEWPIVEPKKVILPSKTKPTPTPYDEEIKDAFKKDWANATQILSHTDKEGKVQGENTAFKHEDMDIPNRIRFDEKSKKWVWDSDAPIVQIKNPFTGKLENSVDRGIFRINNRTFYDFLKRKPELLKKYGITKWDDMLVLKKNIRMAQIIHSEQGWCAWFSAPEWLCPRK